MTMKSQTGAKHPTRRPAVAKSGRSAPPRQFKRKALNEAGVAPVKSGRADKKARPETTGGRELSAEFDRWLNLIYLPRHNDESR